jgi:hypothetical protein
MKELEAIDTLKCVVASTSLIGKPTRTSFAPWFTIDLSGLDIVCECQLA